MKKLLCLLLLVSMPLQAAEKKLEKVTFRLPWFPVVTDAFMTIGIKKGFFKDEGIDLSLVSTKGSPLAVQAIATGESDIGIASADAIIIARSKGAPVKALAVFHQELNTGLFSLKEKNILKPADLAGKKVAPIQGSANYSHFQAFVKKEKLDVSKMNITPHNAANPALLTTGEVDALSMPEHLAIPFFVKEKKDYNELRYRDFGIRLYGGTLLTNEKTIQTRPDLLKKLTRATIKSWRYAIDHPEEAAKSFVEQYPDLSDELISERVKIASRTMESDETKKHGLGYQSKDRWEQVQNFLLENQLMEKATPVEEVFTTKFLK